jgi:AraC-like DNA-binding protein
MQRRCLAAEAGEGPRAVRALVGAVEAAMQRPFALEVLGNAALDYRMEVVLLGAAMIGRLRSTPIAVSLGRSRADADTMVLEVPLDGRGFQAEQQGIRHEVGPGEALLSLGRLPRRNLAPGGIDLAILQLPLQAFEPWLSSDPGRHGARAMGALPATTPGLRALASYLVAVVDGPDPADAALASLMAAQVHELSLALVRTAWPERRRGTATRRAHEARRHVLDHLSSADLDEASVARDLGVAGSTVRRWFAPDGGLAHFVRAQRLARARAMLADPGCARLRVIDIATACGFHEVSTFNRLCRREWGTSPSALRRAAGQAGGPAR